MQRNLPEKALIIVYPGGGRVFGTGEIAHPEAKGTDEKRNDQDPIERLYSCALFHGILIAFSPGD